jgi:hypothetical protein
VADSNSKPISALTLSINSKPGEDKRFQSTSIDSIFTFGDFRVERNISSDLLEADAIKASFSSYGTLSNLKNENFNVDKILESKKNDLNINGELPTSHSYFGSFYTKVAKSINDIIEKFPFAIYVNNFNTGITAFDYSYNVIKDFSEFKVPITGLTNQGDVIFTSGFTSDRGINLYDNTNQFEVQLQGTGKTSHEILSYKYVTGVNGFLEFKISGEFLINNISNSTNVPFYIRPSIVRYEEFKKTLSNLEKQILIEQIFMVPEPESDTYIRKEFIWPKTIDGFNPDSYGLFFEGYTEDLLKSCQELDESKTNWMIRTMIPENYLDLDSENKIYQKLISVYSAEFDTLKQYIDGISYAHTVSYSKKENVPDRFLHKLSHLLGWKHANNFTDVDIFEYLTSGKDEQENKSLEDYDNEIWRRILINLNWLYKKKGTRDAITFIFKLIGAPECIYRFNEFVYKVNKVVKDNLLDNDKVNGNGFINTEFSELAFQEGGEGVGDGSAYIKQWEPEFNLEKVIDNKKIFSGNPEFNGTENFLNTKELELAITPAYAIECDVKDWYNFGFGTWLWGSLSSTTVLSGMQTSLTFSGLSSVPFEWQVDNLTGVTPYDIQSMTIDEYMDFVYKNNIDPRNRKTSGSGHMSTYLNLKKIYMTYMLWTNNQPSNRLTLNKLEKFLSLIEISFNEYIPQLLPATAIDDVSSVVYKNTLFNRQKFVYPEGINQGSEFQLEQKYQPDLIFNPIQTKANFVKNIGDKINSASINVVAKSELNDKINSVSIISNFKKTLNVDFKPTYINSEFKKPLIASTGAIKTNVEVLTQKVSTKTKDKSFNGTIIIFPE